MKRALATVLLTVSVSACSGAADAEPPTLESAPVSPTAVASPTIGSAGAPPVRTCESHVVGDISGWRRDATILGPVGFVGLPSYADAPDRLFRSHGGRYPAVKALLVVERGSPVTIRILQPDLARLMYDPTAWGNRNHYLLEQADPEMVFEPCDFIRRTQFNGAWLVTGRTCVVVEVTGIGRETERVEVPLGLTSCDGT